MKSIRKRKVAKAYGLEYKNISFEYKGMEGYDEKVYDLNVMSSYGSISSLVRSPYTENFILELEFLKGLNIKNGIIMD